MNLPATSSQPKKSVVIKSDQKRGIRSPSLSSDSSSMLSGIKKASGKEGPQSEFLKLLNLDAEMSQ